MVSRRLSQALIAMGLALLGVWLVARIDTTVASRAAIARFSAPAAPAAGNASGGWSGWKADTALWSPQRITAFRETLQVRSASPLAVLAIPRLGLEAPVFAGTDEVTLNRGLGWIPDTAPPGSRGNAGIAGHRDGFFRPLKDVAVNDVIELRVRSGVQRFIVRGMTIVAPSRVDVLDPVDEPTLTLVTCYPFYFVGSAPQRFIVRAVRTDGGKEAPEGDD
jgi:sortase A